MINIERSLHFLQLEESNNFVDLVAASGLDPTFDFRYANFENMNFSDCNLEGFDFTGSDFSKAILGNANFSGAILTDAAFPPGKKPRISRAEPGEALTSLLNKLIHAAVHEGQAADRADAIREINRVFPQSSTAVQFIRERRSADKSKLVRKIAWELSGETSHPSLPLFETIVRARRTESARTAINDLVKKQDIDELEYEFLSNHYINSDISIIRNLDKRGFSQKNKIKAFSYIIENIFSQSVDKCLEYLSQSDDKNLVNTLSELIISYPTERYGINERRYSTQYDVVSKATVLFFENKNTIFFQNFEIVNRLMKEKMPLSQSFCDKFLGISLASGVDKEIYTKIVQEPYDTETFENIIRAWIKSKIGEIDNKRPMEEFQLFNSTIDNILNFHPYGVILKSDPYSFGKSDKSEISIILAKEFVDTHSICRYS